MGHKITEDMTIGGILKTSPKALVVLQNYGLGCADCALNTMETLEEGAKAHGLSDDDIQKMVRSLSVKPKT